MRRHHHPFGAAMSRLSCVTVVACLTGATWAQEAPSTDDTMVQLRRLLEAAPARQLGQPGNDLIDRMIQQRFAEAAARHNDAQRQAEADAQVAEADRAQKVLTQAIQAAYTGADQSQQSGALTRYTVEEPGFITMAMIIVAAVFVGASFYQKRRSLLISGIAAGGLAVALQITAAVVVTHVEQTNNTPGEGGTNQDENTGISRTTVGLSRDRDQALRAAVEAELRAAEALEGLWHNGRVTFPTTGFVPGKATLSLEGDQSVRIYQLTPNLVDPGNLAGDTFTGPLVYVGKAHTEDLKNRDLRGAAAVVEFNCGRRWLDCVQLGAGAIIVLEPPDGRVMRTMQASEKLSPSPISVPRFYMKRDDLHHLFSPHWRTKLMAGPRATIEQEPGRWQAIEAAVDWLLIPGTEEIVGDQTPFQVDIGRQLVHLQTFKDSSSFVPELSPGATGASNLVLMLRLLDHFESHPPKRPVLLSVANDHANALLGELEFAYNAFVLPDMILDEMNWLDKHAAQQRFIADLYAQTPDHELIERLRYESRKLGGQVITLSKPIKDRLLLQRNRLRDRERAVDRELEALNHRSADVAESASADAPKQLIESQLAALQSQRVDLRQKARRFIKLMNLFNRLGTIKRFGDLNEIEHEELLRYFADVSTQARHEAEHLARARRRLASNLALRRRLCRLKHPNLTPKTIADKDPDDLLKSMHAPLSCVVTITLDLSFDSDRLGFFYKGHLVGTLTQTDDERGRISPFARLSLKVAEDYSRETGKANRLTDTMRYAKGLPWEAHMGAYQAIAASQVHAFDMPAATLSVVRDSRATAFTPHDTIEQINVEHFRTVMKYAESYLLELIDYDKLGAAFRQIDKPRFRCVEVTAHEQNKYSINPAEAPTVDGALMVAYKQPPHKPKGVTMLGDVRPWLILLSGPRGAATLRGPWGHSSLQVFTFDDDYRSVQSVLDLGDGEKSFTSSISGIDDLYVRQKVITFPAHKVDLIGLTEPLTLRPAAKVTVLNAAQNSLPRHYGMSGIIPPTAHDGAGCLFVEPGMSFKLKIGAGLAVNIDPTLDVAPDHPDASGIGFPSDVGILRHLGLTTTKDLHQLADKRLKLLAGKGVDDEAADGFNKDVEEKLRDVKAAQEAGHGNVVLKDTEEARGLAFRAYDRVQGTIHDLILAVIFFLTLVIPFCFFVMKLTTPFTDVNRQLAMFGAVFLAMAIVLRFVHPAFEIATTPQVVILAFVILGLAVFVASILLDRFNASMNSMVEQTLQAESVEAPQGRLAGVAFMVGINNMKRRRIRTSLTTATIVLVTFTILSVISVGRVVEPVRLRHSSVAPYNGFLFTAPGNGMIDSVRMHRLRAHFEDGATTVARAWTQRQDFYGSYISFELLPLDPIPNAQTQSLEPKVLLGMEATEDGFIAPMPLVAGRWISDNNADEIILSVASAKLLGIGPHDFEGRTLLLHGRALTLVGLLDDEKLENIEDLAQKSVLPMMVQASLSVIQSAPEKSDDQARDLSSETTIPGSYTARPEDVAIIPIDVAFGQGCATYRTLSVKYEEDKDGKGPSARAWFDANQLTAFQHVRLNVGLTEPVELENGRQIQSGQYALASSTTAHVGGVLKIAIPTILAATIIFNTMLGSVMERKREIGIYNAIGLNPTHVMMFFLAESLVYGLVGAVAGYLIGQILSVVITQLDIVELNLNYSSLSVLVVIFLSMATVLLSTLYPATLAARAAVPSGQRRWAAPQPTDDEVHVNFPFSYDTARVLGSCAYLHAFMQQNSEASTGRFLATLGRVGWIPASSSAEDQPAGSPGRGAQAGRVYVMLFDIAPAPFDLGVNQTMQVYAYYDAHVRAHMLSVHMQRISGQRSDWIAVNQPFLEALRQRLLGWRSQRPETQEHYYELGEKIFANAPQLPVHLDDLAMESDT